jgi:chromate transporter
MIYLKLFLSFLQVGLFSIGGGYAALPLIQAQVVDLNPWLSLGEFTDLITIAEMTPGPIAVNSATFVGIRIAGIPGALIATFGCILPSCMIVSILYHVYRRYRNLSVLQNVLSMLRPAVVALIAAAGFSILTLVIFQGEAVAFSNVNWVSAAIFILSFLALRIFKCNPIPVMMAGGAVSLAIHCLMM